MKSITVLGTIFSFDRQRSWLLSLCATIWITGCAATQKPPCSYDFREQGFVGATKSVLTNEYERCTEHLRTQLMELEVQVAGAKRDATRLDALATQSDTRRQNALQRLADSNRASRAALDDLNSLRAQSKTDRQYLDNLIKRQEALEEKKKQASAKALAGRGDDASLKAEVSALESQQKALRAAIDAELSS